MKVYKKLFHYMPDMKVKGILSMILTVLSNLLLFLAYYKIWILLRKIFTKQSLDGVINNSIMIVGLFIIQGIVYLFGVWSSHLAAFRLETVLRTKGAESLVKASESFFSKNSSGTIRKMIDNNVEQTHMAVAHLIPDTTAAIFTPILMLALVFKLDLYLGIFFVLIIVISMMIMKAMMGEQRFMDAYMKKLDELNAGAVEYVRFMPVVKIFNAPLKGIKSLYDSIIGYKEMVYMYSMSCRIPYVAFQWLLNIFIVSPVFLAIFMVSRGEDPALWSAKVLFFTLFMGLYFSNMMKIMYVSMHHFVANKSVDNLENLFSDMKKDTIDFKNHKELKSSDIVFKDVDFSYEENKKILNDFNLELKSGKSYALVGGSGSGKSTIAKLISGLYPVDSGKILLGGEEISSYDEDFLMDNIGTVFQHPKLFKGLSIYDNVLLAKKGATKDEVLHALKKARCYEFIDKFSDGFDAIIGSDGINLSGGEIQRISIARIFLKDPKIIILDEASAAADPENEYELQLAFKELIHGRTSIMIAHRLSSIMGVDEILVVEDGKIIERGTHDDLLRKNGRYKYYVDLYESANEWRV